MLWLDLAGCVQVSRSCYGGGLLLCWSGRQVVVGYVNVPCSFGNMFQGYCCIVFLAFKEVDKLFVVELLVVLVKHTENLLLI